VGEKLVKIIGHHWVESEQIVEIDSIDHIKRTPVGSILLFDNIDNSIDLLKYCHKESLPSAVRVDSIKNSLFANSLDVRYIIASKDIVEDIQSIAQQYLFDTQIIVEISSEDEIEIYAKMGIDGVLFSSAIERVG